jgi:hypothetical protein
MEVPLRKKERRKKKEKKRNNTSPRRKRGSVSGVVAQFSGNMQHQLWGTVVGRA